MPTHKKSVRVSAGDFSIERTVSVAPVAEAILDQPIPANQTNLEISIFVEFTGLKSFSIWSDVAMTVKTNSSSSPQETFTLAANVPQTWVTGDGTAPIAGDVTKVFVTNTTTGTLKIIGGWG